MSDAHNQGSRWGNGRRATVTLVLTVATLLAALSVVLQLRLDPHVASLLPERGESAALPRYLRAFGGTDLGVVMVRGAQPDEVETVAQSIAAELRDCGTVEQAAAGVDAEGRLDPMLVWRHADARARARLERALSPEGMRQRLRDSRAMLLAPGAGAASETIARDPLRLAQLLADGSGFRSGVPLTVTLRHHSCVRLLRWPAGISRISRKPASSSLACAVRPPGSQDTGISACGPLQ